MFERYTEKSRRVVFYARWEASKYGSRYIDTEHLLLGLLREDRDLAKWFPGGRNVEPEIRAEIETRITLGKSIPEAVEIPLSGECSKVLKLAAETSERLGHRLVEPEHLLIGILRVETSTAAQILISHGLKLGLIEQKVSRGPSAKDEDRATTAASITFDSFLAGFKCLKSDDLIDFFAKNAAYIDATGKTWNREEISKRFETLFAHYAKKNASYHLEATQTETSELLVATVLWKNALLASEERVWIHRMSVVLVVENCEWKILLLQVTPIQASLTASK